MSVIYRYIFLLISVISCINENQRCIKRTFQNNKLYSCIDYGHPYSFPNNSCIDHSHESELHCELSYCLTTEEDEKVTYYYKGSTMCE